MQRLLLKNLAKSKAAQARDIESLIRDFITKQGKTAHEQIGDFLASLVVDTINKYDQLSVGEIVELIQNRIENEFSIKLDFKNIEEIYIKTAELFLINDFTKPLTFVFDKTDVKSIKAMRKNFFWLQDNHTTEIQEELKGIIEEAFKGNVKRADLGDILRDKFATVLDKESRYFQDVSDHIIRQSQNIAKVKQGVKYGVQAYQIAARMDERTSKVCRSLHGRIIPASHLIRQVDEIEKAITVEEKKQAATWINYYYYGKLETNIGLPPYHFKCRTKVFPVFELPSILDENYRAYELGKKIEHDVEFVQRSLKNIAKEGSYRKDPSKRIIQCADGSVVIADHKNRIKSFSAPKDDNFFIKNAEKVIFDKKQMFVDGRM